MQKLLITGATGFIGQHLVKRLAKEAFSLSILARQTSDLSAFAGLNLKVVYADLESPESLNGICRGMDAVIHLAAQVDRPGLKKELYKKINYDATLLLAEDAIQSRVKKFILVSSIAAMGIRDIGKVCEETACQPNIAYGKSKRKIELALLELYETKGLPLVILRPPTVYGEGEKYNFLTLTRQIKKGPFFLIGKGDNLIDFCWVENLTEAIYLSLEKSKTGECYLITDQKPYTMKEAAQTIAELLEVKIPGFSIPKSLAYLAGYLLEFLGKIFHFNPPLFPSRVTTLSGSFCFDISKARRELGYQPSGDFKENAGKTIEWYKQNQLI